MIASHYLGRKDKNKFQGCQLSRIERESHAWTLFLTLLPLHKILLSQYPQSQVRQLAVATAVVLYGIYTCIACQKESGAAEP